MLKHLALLCAVGSVALFGAATTHAQQRRRPEPVAHVRLATDFVREVARQPVDRPIDVRDVILGTSISGVGRIQGRTGLQLVSSNGDAVFRLRVDGTVLANTVGVNGPIRVRSDSTTRFVATKLIRIDSTGIYVKPARVSARSISQIRGISPQYPGLRGWIVGKLVESRRAETERIATRNAERRIQRTLDVDVYQRLAKLLGTMNHSLQDLPLESEEIEIRYGASQKALKITVYGTNSKTLPKVSSPPRSEPGWSIVIHVRRAAIHKALGKDFEENLLGASASARLTKRLNTLASSRTALGPLEVQSTSNKHWLSLAVRRGPALSQSAKK